MQLLQVSIPLKFLLAFFSVSSYLKPFPKKWLRTSLLLTFCRELFWMIQRSLFVRHGDPSWKLFNKSSQVFSQWDNSQTHSPLFTQQICSSWGLVGINIFFRGGHHCRRNDLVSRWPCFKHSYPHTCWNVSSPSSCRLARRNVTTTYFAQQTLTCLHDIFDIKQSISRQNAVTALSACSRLLDCCWNVCVDDA